VYPLLGLLAVIPELIGPFRTWVFAAVATLVCIPILATVRQWLGPRSLAALLDMMTTTVASLCALVVFAIWNIFSRHASYRIAEAYWPAYVLVALAVLIIAGRYALKRWHGSALALRERISAAHVSVADLNHVLFDHPSLAWQRKHWNLLPWAAGLAALGTAVATGIGGRDYLWAALSIVGLPIFLSPVVSVVLMWLSLRTYLGTNRQIQIASPFGSSAPVS
jgi:hypothetical protein